MLIFNGVQTISYDRSFEFIGDNLNYRNVDTLVLNGSFIFSAETKQESGVLGVGFSYVTGSDIWVSLPDQNYELEYQTGEASGLFYSEGNNIYVDLGDGGLVAAQGYTSLHVSDIWDDMDSLINSFQDWNEIIVKGVSLGSGMVKNISFPSSSDATKRQFSVTIEIPKSGDFNTIDGLGSDGLVLDGENLRHVNSISEDFSFSRGSNDQIEMSRSLSIGLTSGKGTNPVSIAKSIAQGFINPTDPIFGIFNYPLFYSDANKTYEESYDVIRGEYSWSERIIRPVGGKTYYWNYGHSITQNENGIFNVSENGEIKGLLSDRYGSALSGWNEIKGNVQSRSESFYNNYNTGEGSLNEVSTSVTRNEVNGVISYGYNYSDDPTELQCVKVIRTTDVNKDKNNLYTISEQGSVVGKCGDSYSGKFMTASGYFSNSVRPYIGDRIQAVFESVKDGSCVEAITAASEDITYAQYDSVVSYNYIYKNRDTSLDDANFRVQRLISKNDSVPTVQFFMAPYKGEVAQYQEQSEMVEESQTIVVQGKTSSLNFNEYLEKATDSVAQPTSSLFYIASNQYNFSPVEKKLELSVSYRYTGSRSRNEADV